MSKIRIGAILAVIALFGAFAASVQAAHTAPPAGGFDLYVDNASPVVAVGGTFHAIVGLDKDAAAPSYQAAQWKIDYDQTVVTTSNADISLVSGAPGACTSKSDNGDTTLLGCLDLSGPNITYGGDVWDVQFTCVAAGTSALPLVETTGGTAKTFVKVGATAQPITTTDSTVTCVDTADVSVTKTGPATVDAGGALTYTVTATNNGPSVWTGGAMFDDLPDDVTLTGCTLDIDVDGDSVVDYAAQPCIPGATPVFPNPFFPSYGPATFINTAIGLVDAPLLGIPYGGIAVGGTVVMTVNATAGPTCGETLVDTAAGVSDGTYGGVEIADPDFLDGVDGTENNISTAVTQVSACPITIDKSGITAGAQGGTGTYTLTVHNAGPSDASNVVVTDTLQAPQTSPTGTVTTSAGNCSISGQTVTCDLTYDPTASEDGAGPATCSDAHRQRSGWSH